MCTRNQLFGCNVTFSRAWWCFSFKRIKFTLPTNVFSLANTTCNYLSNKSAAFRCLSNATDFHCVALHLMRIIKSVSFLVHDGGEVCGWKEVSTAVRWRKGGCERCVFSKNKRNPEGEGSNEVTTWEEGIDTKTSGAQLPQSSLKALSGRVA